MTITEPNLCLARHEPDYLDLDVLITSPTGAMTCMPIPTRQQRIEAIILEANCSRHLAEIVDEFWAAVVRTSRAANSYIMYEAGFDGSFGNNTYHLDDDDLDCFHWVLDLIAPDDHVSAYGSGTAHDLLDRSHCDPKLGERGLVHGKSDGVVKNCTVTLELRHVD